MRIFQTFLLNDDLVLKYKLSSAAVNFSRTLMRGGVFDSVFSLIPLSVKGQLPPISDNGYEIIYCNWQRGWIVFSKLAIIHEQFMIFKKIQKGDSLWFYNLNIMNVFLFILIKLFRKKVKLNIIILDFNPPNSWMEQSYWFLKLINKAHGIICLSDSTLFRVENTAILPGVVPPSSEEYPKIIYPNKEFLLSGTISSVISSTSMVLKAFSQMKDCILHITGNVLEGEEIIIGYAERYPNIKYHGSVSYKKHLDILHKVTYQLSTRDESYPENQFNFPSKIIESLLRNRILISTISYKQIDDLNYFKVDSNCDTFKRQVLEICNMSNNFLKQYANQGNIVKKMFNTEVWNKTMTDIENFSK